MAKALKVWFQQDGTPELQIEIAILRHGNRTILIN
jgi:hypothetical protein